jgi:hypothetical protein
MPTCEYCGSNLLIHGDCLACNCPFAPPDGSTAARLPPRLTMPLLVAGVLESTSVPPAFREAAGTLPLHSVA